VIQAGGLLAVPGLIDLQINGAFGWDFTSEPDGIWAVARQLPRFGVTSFLPTIISSPATTVAQAQEILADGPPGGFRGAVPLGLHLEGPFLNPEKAGAHDPKMLRPPDEERAARWSPAAGVRLVTLAPELPGALAVIARLAAQGVVVGAGHTTAAPLEIQAGIDAGLGYATHLFNAMAPLHHRRPGPVPALLADDQVIVGLIADGIHVHPAVVDFMWKTVGAKRLSLATDAMAGLGMPSGTYTLGSTAVAVDGRSARNSDGHLAGSLLSPDRALRNLMAYTGCSLDQALPTITRTPADILGLFPSKGGLLPGADADLVLLDAQLQVALTVVGGRIAYQRK
jgi:N-acetylglucosamine-6-phosphate deacetylase